MKYINYILFSLAVPASMFFGGCVSPYASKGFTGGYSDTQLAPDAFRVTFSGNNITSRERTQDFALLRAADLTLGHGFRYFAIVNSESGGSTSSLTLPGYSNTSATATGYGNTVYGTATSTYMPPTIIPMFKPNVGLLIRCFVDRPESTYVFDAQFLSKSLRSKYGIH